MLKRVRQDWIEGVLNQSLYCVARIELGLVSKENSAERPSNAVLLVLDQSPTALPPSLPKIWNVTSASPAMRKPLI